MKEITVNGNRLAWQENMTINDILREMKYTFRMLVIKVDGDLVRKTDYATTTVPVGADVKVIHLISGG